MSEKVTTTAARALLRSGLLSLPNPAALARLLGEVARGRTNPCTLLAGAAARWPNRAAIVDDDGTVTYRELQSETETLARQLLDAGVAPGQAVGVLCRNGRGLRTGGVRRGPGRGRCRAGQYGLSHRRTVLHSGSDVDEKALREYLKGRVSRFEQPRDIRLVPSLPRNPAGKVLRKELPS